MTIGQIKLEALMLMYPEMRVPYDKESAEETLGFLSEGLYTDLIASMDTSIQRALFYIELWELTKTKRQVVTPTRKEWCQYYLPMPKDAFLITEVYAKGMGGNIPATYTVLDDEICVLEGASEYLVEYKEKSIKIDFTTPLSKELNLGGEIEAIIPYFIKGELYRESQKEAGIYLDRFFSALDKMSALQKNRTECRISPYKIG